MPGPYNPKNGRTPDLAEVRGLPWCGVGTQNPNRPGAETCGIAHIPQGSRTRAFRVTPGHSVSGGAGIAHIRPIPALPVGENNGRSCADIQVRRGAVEERRESENSHVLGDDRE